MSDHAAHVPGLAHHFVNMEQQKEAGTIGMWLFLLTEIMFFGGLFLAYSVYRAKYPDGFLQGSHLLNVQLGGLNTVVLIVSSLTMAMAVYYSQFAERKKVLGFLALTLVLGSVFLVVKYFEYKEKFDHHLFPAHWMYAPAADHPPTQYHGHVQVFLWIYFMMTGLHALHMIIGIALLLVIMYMTHKGKFTKEYNSPIELFGLYWHFVDIVWIFLFPLLYLTGAHVSSGH